jgi:hypothetical protein
MAEIERLKSRSACVFDDSDVAPSGVRAQSGAGAEPSAAGAKAPDRGSAAAPSHDGLLLSLVRRLGLQGAGRAGDASPNRESNDIALRSRLNAVPGWFDAYRKSYGEQR